MGLDTTEGMEGLSQQVSRPQTPSLTRREGRSLLQLCRSSNTPPQSSGMGLVRFASQAPASNSHYEDALDL